MKNILWFIVLVGLGFGCDSVRFDRRQPVGAADIKTPLAMDGTYVSAMADEKPDTLIIEGGRAVKSFFDFSARTTFLRRLNDTTLVLNIAQDNDWICVLIAHDAAYQRLNVYTLSAENEAMKEIAKIAPVVMPADTASHKIYVIKASRKQFEALVKAGRFQKSMTYQRIK